MEFSCVELAAGAWTGTDEKERTRDSENTLVPVLSRIPATRQDPGVWPKDSGSHCSLCLPALITEQGFCQEVAHSSGKTDELIDLVSNLKTVIF